MVRSRTFSAWGYHFVFLCFGFVLVDPVDDCSDFPFYNRKTEKPAKCNKGFYIFKFLLCFLCFLICRSVFIPAKWYEKPCDCSNHRVSLVRLTGLEPACLGNTRSLVLRVCQFRHNRISDCSAFAEQSLLYTISA